MHLSAQHVPTGDGAGSQVVQCVCIARCSAFADDNIPVRNYTTHAAGVIFRAQAVKDRKFMEALLEHRRVARLRLLVILTPPPPPHRLHAADSQAKQCPLASSGACSCNTEQGGGEPARPACLHTLSHGVSAAAASPTDSSWKLPLSHTLFAWGAPGPHQHTSPFRHLTACHPVGPVLRLALKCQAAGAPAA